MQVHEAVTQAQMNPFIGGFFDYDQLKLPVTPEQIEFEGVPDEQEILELYEFLDETEKREFDKLLLAGSNVMPLLPHQIIPWWRDDWEVFALEGGRGVGKTLTGANGVMEHIYGVAETGKKARVGIAAPTNTAARDVCMEGETGLMTLYGNEFTHYARSLGQIEARHRNGAFVRAMGTEKPDNWNGPQWSLLWIDEYALCNRAALQDAFLALRLGPKYGPYRARAIVTFTPKGMKWTRELMERPDTYVPYYVGADGLPRRPTTFDNPYLPQRRVAEFKRDLLGTRLGQRELLAIEQLGVTGAKWNPDIIHHQPDHRKWPRFVRTVVAIDPAGTSARHWADENGASDEERKDGRKRSATSICVKAKGTDGKIYTLAWVAGRWSPYEWASKAIELFRVFRADRIVAERNFGGDMVEATLRNVWADAPITQVSASKGKEARAEPVVTLYEQGREIHCVVFSDAEMQLCSFVDAKHNEGADYVDSGVWASFELMGWGQGFPVHVMGKLEELNLFVMTNRGTMR
jgi:phage terminase large subunit-like protein